MSEVQKGPMLCVLPGGDGRSEGDGTVFELADDGVLPSPAAKQQDVDRIRHDGSPQHAVG